MKQTKIFLFSLILFLFIISNILAINSTKEALKLIEKNSSFLTTNLENYLRKKASKPKQNQNQIKHTLVQENNNVYAHTVVFYTKLIRSTRNESRTPKIIAEELVQKCPKLNILDEIRENLINCRTIERKLDPRNHKIIQDFHVNCMKKVLMTIQSSCSVFRESNINKLFTSALLKLNNKTSYSVKRLRYIGHRFFRRALYYLRVTNELIKKRLELFRQEEIKRKKIEEEKRKKALKNKKGKGKKKFFLEISSSLLKENSILDMQKNSNLNRMERKKKNKKGLKMKDLEVIIPKNNPYDVMFLNQSGINKIKSKNFAKYIITTIIKINSIN
jgi:hypothetical protein